MSEAPTKTKEELQYNIQVLERCLQAKTEQLQATLDKLQTAEKALKTARAHLENYHNESEQFAYIASHDLQEPLRMVSNYTQLLAKRYKGRLDSEADEFIAFAVEGAARMRALINDLLIYSSIGPQACRFEQFNCALALDNALDSLEKKIKTSGAIITHDPLPVLTADKRQLGQLFTQLLSNAIKFCKQGEMPEVHVGVAENGREWLFFVRDRGIGIQEQYADNIFVIFKRLHNKEQYPGTGIGLAICKKIAQGHGGRIWMESTAGKGTIFYFTLPKEPPG